MNDPAVGGRRAQLRHVAERALPTGSHRRVLARVARQVLRDQVAYLPRLGDIVDDARAPAPVEPGYADWLAAHRIDAAGFRSQQDRVRDRRPAVALAFVVLPGRGDAEVTLRSLRAQTDPAWSAVVLGDRTAHGGEDVRVSWRAIDGDAAAQIDAVIDAGDPRSLIVFAEAGDRFEPDLVWHVAARAWDNPGLDVLHWDDDVIEPTGGLVDPRFRPSWSPEVLWSANPLGRSFAARRAVLRAAGGVEVARGDAAWWDLLMRIDPRPAAVERIPRVLGHLVRRPAPTADEARAVVADHVARSGVAAEVWTEGDAVRVRFVLADPPKVSIVVPTRHNRPNLSLLLPGLAATDYPAFDVHVVDNGGRTDEREAWYAASAAGLDLRVTWWDEPFNYGTVNNAGVAATDGEVVVLLNDDTEILDPAWLWHVVGWATRPEIGLVGVQLLAPDGTIQHGGVVVGMNGFADHLFEGLAPGSDSLLGPTTWYRNCLSVTAACVAVRRELWDRIGGFDERFVLCGSDVVLGFDALFAGHRNVVLPQPLVRHLESATRGTSVPEDDFFASYWRYQKYLFGGDPYFSPNLSLWSRTPRLRAPDEPGPLTKVGEVLHRSFQVFRQRSDEAESLWLADVCRADESLVDRVDALHAEHASPFAPETVNWFLPDIDSPFYGGIATAFRIADVLARDHGVQNQFVIMAAPNERFFRSALQASFPRLADAPITFVDGSPDQVPHLPPADVSIATLWVTAYQLAHFPHTRRKFYLIQDYEPMFYPAGTNYALTEETYRLGLYGLCNTKRLWDLYRSRYGGRGGFFTPALDRTVFHPDGRLPADHDGPVTVFYYARPGHWRNCWELASLALDELKHRLGDRVRIVTAGSWARPDDLGRGITHLGLLDVRDTGALYRRCDLGMALTVSEHPSYLPGEMFACGVPVVAFDNPAGDWILHHGENCLRTPRTVDGLADALEALAVDVELRQRLGKGALATIDAHHSDWDANLSGVWDLLCDPEGVSGRLASELPVELIR